jgi:hypothetical protein
MTYEEVTKCFLGRVDKNKHKKEETQKLWRERCNAGKANLKLSW